MNLALLVQKIEDKMYKIMLRMGTDILGGFKTRHPIYFIIYCRNKLFLFRLLFINKITVTKAMSIIFKYNSAKKNLNHATYYKIKWM
ncbi:MAG: hypothetical protein ACJA1B_002543 [Polaribacter sp.]|jgi:hypothetical protein